jgi:hypothetical protein
MSLNNCQMVFNLVETNTTMKAIIHPNEHVPRMFKNKFLEKLPWSNPVFILFCMVSLELYWSIVRSKISNLISLLPSSSSPWG